MRGLAAFLLAIISLPILAQDNSVEIAGVVVRKGMTPDELRALIPAYAIQTIEVEPKLREDIEIWSVRTGKWADSGEIFFQDGRVQRAARTLAS